MKAFLSSRKAKSVMKAFLSSRKTKSVMKGFLSGARLALGVCFCGIARGEGKKARYNMRAMVTNTNTTNTLPNAQTHQVLVGNAAARAAGTAVAVGGSAPCAVQSMLNAPAQDAEANIAQGTRLVAAGCEILRMAVPRLDCIPAFAEVCAALSVPVVADIHFDARIAIAAAQNGAAKLRINPGNIGGLAACDPVIDAAGEAGIPIRIGVNAGSLDAELATRTDLSLPEKLAQSATGYVEYFASRGFTDVVVSAKAHDVPTTIATYRLLSARLPHVPLHIGVTEAGTPFQGLIKSACGLGVLLEEGIGDTLRISLTSDPCEEVRAAWTLLQTLGLRSRGFEIISCPTCGRPEVDLLPLAGEVEARLEALRAEGVLGEGGSGRLPDPLRVAVMGCVVNGPGEAKDAHLGVACGRGSGAVFVDGQVRRKVAEANIVDALMEEIAEYGARSARSAQAAEAAAAAQAAAEPSATSPSALSSSAGAGASAVNHTDKRN